MRIFVTKDFEKFARAEKVADDKLCDAIRRAEQGLVQANLGGELIKQRVARPGEGKSGGFRTVVAFRSEHRAVFLVGFAKNERDNIDKNDLVRLKALSAAILATPNQKVQQLLTNREWREVICNDEQGEVPEQDRGRGPPDRRGHAPGRRDR